jgi:hypothetical protein
VAGFATPIGSAGHARIAASSQLTFYPGHSLKAGQSSGFFACYRQGFLTWVRRQPL